MKIDIKKLRMIINETLSKRDELASIYSDVYKDVYGVRPRHVNFDEISTDELQRMIDQLYEMHSDVFDFNEPYYFGENPPEEALPEPEPFDDIDPPSRIPFKGGNEYDALSGRSKNLHTWRPGDRKAAKKSYNRRLRRTK